MEGSQMDSKKALQTSLMLDMSGFFKVFGDPTRLSILQCLKDRGLSDVTTIVEAVGASQSTVSQHLKLLKINRLVKATRDGAHMLYSLSDDHIASILMLGREHVLEKEGK
jgi:DNA-binding transcriptional ArsR family regulator